MKSIFPVNTRAVSCFFLLSLFLSILLTIPLSCDDAWAANHDVSNATELEDALDAAENNGDDDTIRIARGTYNGNFSYSSSEGYTITVLGGYDAMFCVRDVDPKNTVLDGQNSGRTLTLCDFAGGDITVDGLTVRNGNDAYGAGMLLRCDKSAAGDLGAITITNNLITDNTAWAGTYYGGGVYLYSQAGAGDSADITFTGNVITGNTAGQFGGGVYIWSLSDSLGQSGKITFTNNVFAGNTASTHYGGGLYIRADVDETSYTCGDVNICNNTFTGNTAGSRGGGLYLGVDNGMVRVYNNIIWGNSAVSDGEDIGFSSALSPTTNGYYNDYADMYGSWTNSDHNINEDPLFVSPARGNYHLRGNSPCINAGIFGKKVYVSLPTPQWIVTNYGFIPADDFEGDSRNSDWIEVTSNNYYKYCDIGADEYTPGAQPGIPLLLLND